MQRTPFLHKNLLRGLLRAILFGTFSSSLCVRAFDRLMPLHRPSLQSMITSENFGYSLVPGDVARSFQLREVGSDVSIANEYVIDLRNRILVWYLENRRLLPWRGDTIECPTSIVNDSIEGKPDQSVNRSDVNEDKKFSPKNDSKSKTNEKKKTNCKDGILSTLTTITVVPPPMSAYGTWVSEIMLQQTRVETVIPYWLKWMKKFPTVQDLAKATGDEVNAMWAGLGYYRRAQQLLKGARKVVEEFDGVLPASAIDLKKIDGIGPYTAGAISSIAFNQAEPLVDGNVIRVISRLFALKETVGSSSMEKASWSIAGKMVDTESPGNFNQALMELGATTCKPTSPNCSSCPLAGMCRARILVDFANRNIDERNRINQYAEIRMNTEIGNVKKLKSVQKTKAIKSKIILKHDDTSTNKDDTEMNSPDTKDKSEDINAKGFDENSGLNIEGYPVCISYFPQKLKKKEPKEIHFYVTVFMKKNISHFKNETEKIKKEKEGTKKKEKVLENAEDTKLAKKFLFVRRPDKGGLLANQWEFPNFTITPKSILPTSTDAERNDFNANSVKDKEGVISRDVVNIIRDSKGNKANEIDATNDHDHVVASRAFLRNTLGVDWLPYKNEKVTSVFASDSNPSSSSSSSSSSCTAIVQRVVEEKNQKRKFSKINSDPDSSARIKVENTRDSISDLKYVFTPSSPTLRLPPVIHIFSHQKHIMHISLNQITQNGGVEEDQPWETLCGEEREIRWMTKDEIIAAGITSGCKKILIESLKILE